MSSTLHTTITRFPLRTIRSLTRISVCTTRLRTASTTEAWEGRQPSEHATNRKDGLDIQSSASNSGQQDRSKGVPGSNSSGGGQSQATTEKDRRNQNEQAQKDHPEAPGPVIGMNDERGQMGHKG